MIVLGRSDKPTLWERVRCGIRFRWFMFKYTGSIYLTYTRRLR